MKCTVRVGTETMLSCITSDLMFVDVGNKAQKVGDHFSFVS